MQSSSAAHGLGAGDDGLGLVAARAGVAGANATGALEVDLRLHEDLAELLGGVERVGAHGEVVEDVGDLVVSDLDVDAALSGDAVHVDPVGHVVLLVVHRLVGSLCGVCEGRPRVRGGSGTGARPQAAYGGAEGRDGAVGGYGGRSSAQRSSALGS